MSHLQRLARLVILILSLAFVASPALAGRFVVVNGVLMNAEQLAILDGAACTFVPDGRYWIAPNGAWGYEGVPQTMGFVGSACAAPAAAPAPEQPRHKSLSERGMLYSPYDWVR